MPHSLSPDEKKFATAAFRQISAKGWDSVTVEQIAKDAKIPLARVTEKYPDMSALIPTLVHFITAETVKSVGSIHSESTPHDRLFEVMMARFDVLQKHRAAILSIITAAKNNPRIALALITAQRQAMHTMLDCAQLSEARIIARAGLMATYAASAFVWSRDETLDMSKTMSFLDRILRGLGKLAAAIK